MCDLTRGTRPTLADVGSPDETGLERACAGGPTATTLATISNQTWAPDGSALAWYERQTDANGNVVAEGIFGMAVGDIASSRPSPGERHLLISGAKEPFWGSAPIGSSTPRRSPTDYNGDGKADFGIFRPSTGAWYVAYTGGGTTSASWGSSGDIPLPLPSAIRMVYFP